MRKLLAAGVAALAIAFSGGAAEAGYRHYHYYHDDGAVFAAGVIGGALVTGVRRSDFHDSDVVSQLVTKCGT